MKISKIIFVAALLLLVSNLPIFAQDQDDKTALKQPKEKGEVILQAFSLHPTLKARRRSDPNLRHASELGATAVRPTPNFFWNIMEPELGKGYRWRMTDAEVMLAQLYGLNYNPQVAPVRPEYLPACAQRRKENRRKETRYLLPHYDPKTGMDLWKQYKDWLRALVERYDGDGIDDMPGLTRPIKIWDFSGELPTDWCSDNPEKLVSDIAAMFKMTYEAVHAADPNAQLILPLDAHYVYLAAFADGYLLDDAGSVRQTTVFKQANLNRQKANTGKRAAIVSGLKKLLAQVAPDGYDIHLYGDARSIPERKKWLLDYVQSQGLPVKPVYSHEGGEPFAEFGEIFPAGPDKCSQGATNEDASRLMFQAGEMVKHFALAFASGYDGITFNLAPEYERDGTFYGDLDLLDVCRNPRPAYYTFKLARQKLVPFVNAEEITSVGSSIRICHFTFATRPDVWVAWDTAQPHGVFTAHNLSKYLNFTTAKITHPVIEKGKTTGDVTYEPVNSSQFGGTPVFLESAK